MGGKLSKWKNKKKQKKLRVTLTEESDWVSDCYSFGSFSFSEEEEKCYDPQDRTLTFVDEEDVLDCKYHIYEPLTAVLDMDITRLLLSVRLLVEYYGYRSLKARMSCGHAVTPMSLTRWCRRQLDEVHRCGLKKNSPVS